MIVQINVHKLWTSRTVMKQKSYTYLSSNPLFLTKTYNLPSEIMPTPLAMALAVIGWSPVTMMTLIPALRHLLTASGTAARGGSIMDINPTKHRLSRGKLGGCQEQEGSLTIIMLHQQCCTRLLNHTNLIQPSIIIQFSSVYLFHHKRYNLSMRIVHTLKKLMWHGSPKETNTAYIIWAPLWQFLIF